MVEITFDQLPKAVTQLHEKLESIERLLLDQLPQQEVDELLTVQQAAELLHLSVPTIYGYVQRREIPVSKRSKRLYFSKQQLMEWIKAGRLKTVKEIDADANDYLCGTKKGGKR